MKKLYVLPLALTMATASFAQRDSFTPPTQEFSDGYGFVKKAKGSHSLKWMSKSPVSRAEETPYDILSCKEGSVFGNEYTEETYWSGSASADAGRPEQGMYFFQHFDDCYQTFNEVRFLGFFNYWDQEAYSWYYCDGRGNMDENGNMQSPVVFTVGIYEEDENGLPGKCILSKDMEIIGEKTRVQIGDESAGYTAIYEFAAELGQEIDLEHGFIQFNAKDMGDSPTCWFALFTVGGQDALQMDVANEDYSGQLGAAFCLYGDGSYNAKKALQLERFLTPSSSANGKYEKVQIELTNIGENPVSDARLELYVDGKLVATEDVNATIAQFESYKFTFAERVDCTSEHKITVRNVTPGDEKKSYESISRTITPPAVGDYPECKIRVPNTIMITNVKLGDMENASEGGTYTDYTDKKATIRTGETLPLNITLKANDYKPSLAVYIDWNGDHNFSYDEAVAFDEFKADDNGGSAVATISVPETAVAGEQRMRLVAVPYYYTPEPAGSFYTGEVEDYTIVIERAAGSSVAGISKSSIDVTLSEASASSDIVISNDGEGKLIANAETTYSLPERPRIDSNAPRASRKAAAKGKFNVIARQAATKAAPEKEESTQFVLRYDRDIVDCIGLGNSATAIFANMYPGAMLANLEGMTINSIDVYIGTKPLKSSIVIYGQNKQDKNGELIAQKSFKAVEKSWNHIVLDNPITIGSSDIWVGVRMEGMNSKGYYIGVDEGPAMVGFGDIVNIGGSTWWSMSDLGLDYNYCIRANVAGTRTPVIDWLSLDKTSAEVAPGASENIAVALSAKDLKKGIYEAQIEVTTNDPLANKITIPVYMVNGDVSSVSEIESGKPAIIINGSVLTVTSPKAVAQVKVTDLAGRCVMDAPAYGNEASVDLAAFGKGLFIVTVVNADGTSVSVKVPVK